MFRRRIPEAPRPSVTEGRVVYAIGDVHGRADLLAELLGRVRADAAARAHPARPALVFLGDYIDRGPQSREVIDHVLHLQREGAFEVRAVKGNHEHALLTFLADASFGPTWASYGGLTTIHSYLQRAPQAGADAQAWEATRQELSEALPRGHVEFFEALELYYLEADYLFVHAGLRPGIPLDQQAELDLMAIRRDFLSWRQPFEKFVVYGHTPGFEPAVEPHRIGIDTGAFVTGVLTCLRLEGCEREFIHTGAPPAGSLGLIPAEPEGSLLPVKEGLRRAPSGPLVL